MMAVHRGGNKMVALDIVFVRLTMESNVIFIYKAVQKKEWVKKKVQKKE